MPMKALMEGQTGLSGDLIPCGDADHLARQIKDNDMQLGVFHGVEFAWVHQTYPTLKPLVIAVNEHPYVLRPAGGAGRQRLHRSANLQGKVVALPRMSREHCRLFLERRCCGADHAPEKFFSASTHPSNAEDALDDVVDDNVQAAVVDEVSLDAFRKDKPGRGARLKVLQQSESFPCRRDRLPARRPDREATGCFPERFAQSQGQSRGPAAAQDQPHHRFRGGPRRLRSRAFRHPQGVSCAGGEVDIRRERPAHASRSRDFMTGKGLFPAAEETAEKALFLARRRGRRGGALVWAGVTPGAEPRRVTVSCSLLLRPSILVCQRPAPLQPLQLVTDLALQPLHVVALPGHLRPLLGHAHFHVAHLLHQRLLVLLQLAPFPLQLLAQGQQLVLARRGT